MKRIIPVYIFQQVNVDEMEQVGLIRFDEFGNVGILVLEGQ
ncbi:Uncharacterised protein [Streptococcus pneumoniae]|nr:Uncharacterised protein [Streptococcus pneumoniae]